MADYKDAGWLSEKYHDEGLSTRAMADLAEVSKNTIRRWMDKHGIERRGRSGKRDSETSDYRDPDWLREKYHTEGMSLQKIGSLANVAGTTIGKWMDKHGIERRDKNEPNRIDGMSDEFRQILAGELLGDGSIAQGGIFWYGTSREGYRDWLAHRFAEQGFEIRITHQQGYRFRTLTYACLKEWQDRWYPEGTKSIPDSLELTPLALRHWYIGDGTRNNRDSAVFLTAKGLTDEERDALAAELCELGIYTSVHNQGRLYVKQGSHDALYGYMADLPDELDEVYGYKWP